MRGVYRWVPRQPLFYPESDVSVTVQTTEPPALEPSPTPEPPSLIHLAQQVGELLATVNQLKETIEPIVGRVEMLETEDRWTNERISDLAREVYSSLMQVEEQIETLQQEEQQPEEQPEVTTEIPALPPAEQQQQETPEPEKKRRPWFL